MRYLMGDKKAETVSPEIGAKARIYARPAAARLWVHGQLKTVDHRRQHPLKSAKGAAQLPLSELEASEFTHRLDGAERDDRRGSLDNRASELIGDAVSIAHRVSYCPNRCRPAVLAHDVSVMRDGRGFRLPDDRHERQSRFILDSVADDPTQPRRARIALDVPLHGGSVPTAGPLAWPVPVTTRLEAFVAQANALGIATSRAELLGAIVCGLSPLPDPLKEWVESYRVATVRATLLEPAIGKTRVFAIAGAGRPRRR
jgi:hypothetical protein